MSDQDIEEFEVGNDHLVLICGESSAGKSACLRDLENPEAKLYLNCEGKKLPFKSKFMEEKITDPEEIIDILADLLDAHEDGEETDVDTVIIDTATFMMEQYESQYVIDSANTQKAWGDYNQFFKRLMFEYVARLPQSFIFLAHTTDFTDDAKVRRHAVKVKGALMNTGIEAYFSTVILARRVELKELKGFKNDLLTITEKEERRGVKYVLQTDITKSTVNTRIRSPIDMWDESETFIDGSAQAVMDRLNEFYEE